MSRAKFSKVLQYMYIQSVLNCRIDSIVLRPRSAVGPTRGCGKCIFHVGASMGATTPPIHNLRQSVQIPRDLSMNELVYVEFADRYFHSL